MNTTFVTGVIRIKSLQMRRLLISFSNYLQLVAWKCSLQYVLNAIFVRREM